MNYATMVRRRRLIEAVLYTSEYLYEKKPAIVGAGDEVLHFH